MKQSIIKISTPAPKVQGELGLPEADQTSLPEELLEPESIDMHQPVPRNYTVSSGGWKASDILREMRLDSFE
ncbi:hypothetical protein F7734_04960 [Scytonema sp. UIC 10036]|uniref:hypothetical protein n=1 Tax=Scytonema sp. UIC 10036 TaxID=2304196 RepID=UPI0012DAE374|nr:hypothetical protein [Scytonema sp. UIC 10036]MUG91856.1 hypothetical protein [Scytonema sp. UIC 10036]